MRTDQIKHCEETALKVIQSNHVVYAQETPLPVAKEIQGLRAVFDEVSPLEVTSSNNISRAYAAMSIILVLSYYSNAC